MALYIRGDRILTEEEKQQEDAGGCGMIFAYLMAAFCLILFILSPGIFITSLLSLCVNLTSDQLWIGAIVGSIFVVIIIALVLAKFSDLNKENFGVAYLLTALICSAFMIVFYFYKNNNCFSDTVSKMIESESSTESNKDVVKGDSISYSSINNDTDSNLKTISPWT